LAVGRKNYLHAGSEAGAERAAALYTVLRTFALNRVDAYA
jgi:transposase